MPVDDFIDIRLTLGSDELEKIDQQISKAKQKLREGSQSDTKFEGQISTIEANVRRDQVLQFGNTNQSRLKNFFGNNIGSNLFSIGQNPVGFLQGAILGSGLLAGAGIVLQITKQVIDKIKSVDVFLKTFIDLIDTRFNQLRNPEVQARIKAGQVQLIITTESGTTDPREAYNTFEQFNNNRSQLESDFAIRNTQGYV